MRMHSRRFLLPTCTGSCFLSPFYRPSLAAGLLPRLHPSISQWQPRNSLRLGARSRSLSMAAVLESLAVPRASGFRTSLLSRPAAAMAAASSVGRPKASAILPEFSGLRIQTRAPRLSLKSERRGRRTARHGIVCEAQETAVDVPAVTDATWQSLVIESNLPVLVEFWAPWCGPCRMIHPVIDELSREYAGKLKCFKVNTDECASIATQYGIRSIPTVIVFKNGEKKDAIIGAVPKTTLIASIDKFL